MAPKADEPTTEALVKDLEDVQAREEKIKQDIEMYDRELEQWKKYEKDLKNVMTREDKSLLQEGLRLNRAYRERLVKKTKAKKQLLELFVLLGSLSSTGCRTLRLYRVQRGRNKSVQEWQAFT